MACSPSADSPGLRGISWAVVAITGRGCDARAVLYYTADRIRPDYLAVLGDLTGCSPDNFQVVRMQANTHAEKPDAIAATGVGIAMTAGIQAVASRRHRPAGFRNRRENCR